MATAAELVSQGFYGYAGWDDASADADFRATGGQGKGAATAQPSIQPTQPTIQPTQQTQPSIQPTQATQPGQPSSAQDLINMGYYGYQGWGNAEAVADYKATGGQGKGGPTSGGGTGAGIGTTAFNQPTIDLTGLYDSLYKSSGIREVQDELSAKTRSYNEAVSKIRNNPYLSEATMSGRLKKLSDKFEADNRAVLNDIAMRKADIETKLNLETKQFDINSQQAQQAFNQFQSLLSSGALDNASGQDIANITRATGISSSMIQSAIDANKKKNIQTSIQSYDDGTNQGFVVINSQTGEIINKQTVAQSKPKAASVTDQRIADEQQTQQNAVSDIQAGSTLRDIISHYAVSGGLDIETIYRLYNQYSPYGTAEESLDDVKEGVFVA